MTKICTKCKIEYSLEEFHKHKGRKDGYADWCKSCKRNEDMIYQKNHRKEIEHYKKKYAKLNKDKINSYKKDWRNDKYKNDIIFRLKDILRSRLRISLKRNSKTGSAVKDLGCTIDFFKSYLESKWQPGMSWNNYGKKSDQWSIDHIIPLSAFNLTDREQLLKACNYNNLQPMWHIDNIKKSDN